MASVASPLTQLGMARPSPTAAGMALPPDAPRIPEVLVVCLIHDSTSLRARWPELLEAVLSPLFCRYVALQEDSRLLVGGIVYRSEPAADLESPLRLEHSLVRIPFLTTPRFAARATQHFGSGTCMSGPCFADDVPMHSTLVDGVAAALEMLSARDLPAGLPHWAQTALQAHHSQVSSRHIVHIVAAPDATPPVVPPSLRPVLNSDAALDHMAPTDMVALLAQQSIGVCTVASSSSSRAASTLLHSQHAMLAHQSDQDGDIHDLMGDQWQPPPGVDVLASGIALGRLSNKRGRTREEALPSAKRAKAAAAQPAAPAQKQPGVPQPGAPQPGPKIDQTSVNKFYLLQQQLATMLKNLAQLANKAPAAGIQRSLQAQMVEQIKQQLIAQQNAIRAQAEVLRAGRQPNLNVILQALINIDKEAKESGLHLGGPSSAVTRTAIKTPRPPTSQRPAPFWQGLLRWNLGGQSQGAESFSLVAATASASFTPAALALPWPNALTIKALLAAGPQELQRLIVKHRVPCVLLSLRPFPPTLAVRGAENNESNYRMLATLLERNQRVAYVPHGAPDCGLLVTAVPSTPPSGSSGTPATRLVALVFPTPIPFDRLSSTPALNRGIASTNPPATPVTPMAPQVAMPGIQYNMPQLQTSAITPGMPMALASQNPAMFNSTTSSPATIPQSGSITSSSPYTFGDTSTLQSSAFALSQVLGTQGQTGIAFPGVPSSAATPSLSGVQSTGLGINPLIPAVQPQQQIFPSSDLNAVDQLRALGLM